MNSYRLLMKKEWWIIKNHVLEIKRNPKRMIIYILYILWIGSLVFNAIINNKTRMIKSNLGLDIINAIYISLILALFMYNLHKGIKESSTFFSLADVHILFPSPMSSKKILLYNMIKQSIINFFLYGIAVIAFIPIISTITNMDLQYIGFMYIGYISAILLIEPLNFLIFAIGTKYKIQNYFEKSIYAIIGGLFIYLIWNIIDCKDIISGILVGLNAEFIDYIPIIGFSRMLFMIPIKGYESYKIIILIAQLGMLCLFIFLAYHMADDYYEDVLQATEQKEYKRRVRKGLTKNTKKSFFFKERQEVSVKKMGTGPMAFIWRTKVQYKRQDVHPYYGMVTLIFLVIGLIVGYIYRKSGNLTPVYIVNGAIAYILLIFSAAKAKTRDDELSKPYIYLVPGSSAEKIIAMNLVDIIRITISVLVLNITVGLLIKVPIYSIVIMSIFIISFYILNLSSSLLVRIIFPNSIDQTMLFPLFFMLQLILLIIPGAIIGAIMALAFKNSLALFVGISLANSIIIGIIFLLNNVIFERLEWR